MDAQELLATIKLAMVPAIIDMEPALAGQYDRLFTEVPYLGDKEPASAVSYGLSFSVVADDDDRADKGCTPASQATTVAHALIRACREFREYEGAAVLNDALWNGLCASGRNAWDKAPLSADSLKIVTEAIRSAGRSAHALVVPAALSEIESDVRDVLRQNSMTLIVNDYLEHADTWFVVTDAAKGALRRVAIAPLNLTAEYDPATDSVMVSATERVAFECDDPFAVFTATAANIDSRMPVSKPHRTAMAA